MRVSVNRPRSKYSSSVLICSWWWWQSFWNDEVSSVNGMVLLCTGVRRSTYILLSVDFVRSAFILFPTLVDEYILRQHYRKVGFLICWQYTVFTTVGLKRFYTLVMRCWQISLKVHRAIHSFKPLRWYFSQLRDQKLFTSDTTPWWLLFPICESVCIFIDYIV